MATLQPVGVFGVQRSRKPLLTLTGLLCASKEMFAGLPRLPDRYAMNESLYEEQTYSGHSPDQKSKSNESPCAFAGTLRTSFRSMKSCTVGSIGHPAAAFGKPGGA